MRRVERAELVAGALDVDTQGVFRNLQLGRRLRPAEPLREAAHRGGFARAESRGHDVVPLGIELQRLSVEFVRDDYEVAGIVGNECGPAFIIGTVFSENSANCAKGPRTGIE